MSLSTSGNKYVRTLCAILFCLFSLFYLYFYQADIMALTQHVFSDGQTHYHRVVGTVIVTFTLMLVQFGVGRFFKRQNLIYALSYFPSAMLLAALTGISKENGTFTFGSWGVVLPAVLAVFACLLFWIRKFSYDTRFMYHYSGLILTLSNIAVLLLVFLGVISMGNNSSVLHVQLKAERLIGEGQYDEALETIANSGRQDSCLTMLTVYALSRSNSLGDKLFSYRLEGGTRAMTPDGRTTAFVMYPESQFYNYVGSWVKQRMPADRYLDYLLRHNLGKKPFADYYLSSLLLDKNLDKFVTYILKFYDVKGLLPTHYREALLLYTHLRANPRIIFSSTIMEADFQDFQDLKRKYSNRTECMNKLRDVYGTTYWYYYFYGSSVR